MTTRDSARLVILDDEDRILLFKIKFEHSYYPMRPGQPIFWHTPGGGRETGERFEETATRELQEETGISGVQIGPWIWTSERILRFPDREMLFHERYFLVRTPQTPVSTAGLHSPEIDWIQDFRWWPLANLRSSTEVFVPPNLSALLEPIISGRLPDEPVRIDEIRP